MKFEDQVSSRAPSQRLKELGVKQESIFYYQEKSGPDGWGLIIHLPIKEPEDGNGLYSAFTVGELGEILPFATNSFRSATFGLWDVEHQSEDGAIHRLEQERTEADARAKMLIYLIANGLVKA